MEKDKIKNTLLSKLKETKSPPILFVGSGLSQRYLGTPTWDGLLEHFANIASDNDLAYEMYYQNAKGFKNDYGINPKIAELIERDFNTKWFKDEMFKKSRIENREFVKDKCSPFKIEIANFFREQSNKEYIEGTEKEIELLKKVGDRSIGGVITTNYDCLLEKVFSNYHYSKFIGQEELIFSDITGIGEIYKIHGCCTKPGSIIINEDDYKKFDNKNSYLIAKLLTIFLEYPIIFIGYKIGDKNIQNILKEISKCLSKEHLEKFENRFIFIEWNNTDKKDDVTKYAYSSITMTQIFVKDFSIIYEALLENHVGYNPRAIKKFKKEIYNVVLTSKPSKSIKAFIDIDDSKLDDVEAVVGVGIIDKLGIKGYETFSAEDLCKDIIFDKENLDKKYVVEKSLPSVIKVHGFAPVYKYIQGYEGELDRVIKNYIKRIEGKYEKERTNKLDIFLTKNIISKRKSGEVIKKSIKELMKVKELEKVLNEIVYIDYECLDADELLYFLKVYIDKCPKIICAKSVEGREIRRLIKMYDYMKYKE
ncbi:hypothetical protein G6Y96_09240 [Clostridium perfringens]|uniref:SIR2 family protein n=2 Tax=Clostridium perfringens TaxID=1502 RepID=UPI0013E2F4E3|nr:SIR2 family protein [Clostridium perfringens]NGT11933.1 hypothetical protein [Clostridium perfringens]